MNTNTGRGDFWQELSVPFQLGAVKVVPYGVVDLTEYTQDLNGNEIGRVYGAIGVRGVCRCPGFIPTCKVICLTSMVSFTKSC